MGHIEPWFDVVWAVTLTVLSNDRRDIVAGFLFCTILVTAFQWRLAPGFRLTRVVAMLILSVGMVLGYSSGDAGTRYVLMGGAAMGMWGYPQPPSESRNSGTSRAWPCSTMSATVGSAIWDRSHPGDDC